MTNTHENKPFYYSLSNDRQKDEKLLEPIKYYLQVPGKQITVKLAHAFNYWLKISPDKIQAINEIVTMLCNSCIIIARQKMLPSICFKLFDKPKQDKRLLDNCCQN
ncbi:terpene synthase-like [Polyergus mexicanus]|uniref:terpene synthase-like n=1 Tax=Polyergus mexicanus TaxID=615972 RepID=UPI0038B595D2